MLNLAIVVNLVFLIISCFALVKSSSFLVKSLTKLASFIGLNEFAIGFIIMAISTSLPELFVGVTSALSNKQSLALGNVIGSNILNLTIVIGVVAVLVKNVKIHSKLIKRDVIFMVAMVILPLFLMWDQKISRIDAVILIGAFCVYLWQMVKQEKSFSRKLSEAKGKMAIWITIAVLSIFLLLLSAHFVVHFASELSVALKVPELLIGLFIVSLGTSLPELIFEAKSVLEKHDELAIGDLLGSVIINSSLVLGVTALIRPITADFLLFFSSAIFMVLSAFLFMTFAESEKGISWKEGISLILLYMFFVIVESYIKSLGG